MRKPLTEGKVKSQIKGDTGPTRASAPPPPPKIENPSNNVCFIDNDMSDYVGFINFLRRETGMSKTHTLVALEQCRNEVADILKNWHRAYGKKTSTTKE